MSKKRKVGLTVSAIIVAIGIGAQIYTNNQVERVLQKFPYSLDNQLTLNLTETNKNFFTRDLTFSLENSEGKYTDVISAKLTSLPFFITAESKLSDQLVRQLNKNLNITIDKNTINTKFSPVGDYLQSEILTEFRDFANKSQNLSMTLDFDATSKNVALKSNLSGFNYDKNSKLEQIGGHLKLIPVSENQYDISTIELNAKNAELDLMNGENTKIQLKNAKYQFDVKKGADADATRDLITKFSSDSLRIANKERTTEESQTTVNGLSLQAEQKGVKSAVNFADEFRKLTNDNHGIKNAVNFLVSVLTDNQEFNGTLSVKSVDVPKNQQPYFDLNNAKLNLKSQNSDLTRANVDLQLSVDNVKQTPQDTTKQWEAKGIKATYHLDNYNLQNELAFISFYMDSFAVKNSPKEDNKELLALKTKWAKEMHDSGNLEINLQSLNYNNRSLEGLSFKSQDTQGADQYQGTFRLALKKLALAPEQVQIEDLTTEIPVKFNNYHQFIENQFCAGIYEQLCLAHLSASTMEKDIANQWKALDFSTENANLAFNLNTYPATKAYPFTLNANVTLGEPKENQHIINMADNINATVNIAFDKALIDDSNEASLKIKNEAPFWQYIRLEVKPNGKLSPIFVEDNGNYTIKLETKGKDAFINGKTMEEIHQETMKQAEEDLESEAVDEAKDETQDKVQEATQDTVQEKENQTETKEAVQPKAAAETSKK